MTVTVAWLPVSWTRAVPEPVAWLVGTGLSTVEKTCVFVGWLFEPSAAVVGAVVRATPLTATTANVPASALFTACSLSGPAQPRRAASTRS